MKLDLFNKGDKVLLVGEGNLSFTADLITLLPFLNITSTCAEKDVSLKLQQENISILESKGVRVILGVDGTNLINHPILKFEKETFTKIIFNFPHVGGKMKIHLNRQLLRNFCVSSSNMLSPDGNIIITLCKGQGGTMADLPQRRWDDSWQVVEMAAHGHLVLTDVHPFMSELYPQYKSVGYRSKDVSFHINGALVHVFSKRDPPFHFIEENMLQSFLKHHYIPSSFGKIFCQYLHSSLYNNRTNNSVIKFFKEILLSFLSDYFKSEDFVGSYVNILSEDDIPLYSESNCDNVPCYVNLESNRYFLRKMLHDVIANVLYFCEDKKLVVLSGTVFNKLGQDFSVPPVSNQIMVIGEKLGSWPIQFLNYLKSLFEKPFIKINGNDFSEKIRSYNVIKLCGTFCLEHTVKNITCVALEKYEVCKDRKWEFCIIYPDNLAKIFFNIRDWREQWSHGSRIVKVNNIQMFTHASLYSRSYTFDISFIINTDYTEDKFFNILWQLAGDIIMKVEFVNKYYSPSGWTSHCYRIKYQSFDKPLYREKAIEIHSMIGKLLTKSLGVKIN